MAVDVAATLPADWQYVAEGGATIVFAYIGAPHPAFDDTVLRLRKAKHAAPDEPDEPNEPDDPTVAFQHTIIERLIPPALLPRLDAATVSRPWLADLAALAAPARPAARAAIDAIDLARRKAVLATDLVGRTGLAIEIKPKWGFLPSPTHLAPATRAIKTHTCRFCMHTALRAAAGAPPSAYCPLDLFARDAARVRVALRALWDAWAASDGAANNLRLFVDGAPLRPSDPDAPARLAAVLPLPHAESEPGPALAGLRDAFVRAAAPALRASPVLPTLARLQRTLDALDIDGLAALWARARPGLALGADEPSPALGEWSAFVDTYLATASASDAARAQGSTDDVGGIAEDVRYYVLSALLAGTFKDCSLLFRPAGRVRVIDLDVKSPARLAMWAALDRTIVEAYAKVPEEERRRCFDDAAW